MRVKFLDPAPGRPRAGVLLAALLGAAACGHAPPPAAPGVEPRIILAHDDGRAEGALAFPSPTQESVLRFDARGGAQPVRLWVQAAAPGTVALTLYGTNALDGPGEPIASASREIRAEDVSDGQDGRWVALELLAPGAHEGGLWLGIKGAAGQPRLWTSRRASGRAYLRSAETRLLPVRETPLVRLELAAKP
jgi:hypothetical protein